jgi:hypothetical protein
MTVRGPRRATRADGSTPLGSPSGSPRGELPSATTPTVRSYTHQLSQQVDRTTGSAHNRLILVHGPDHIYKIFETTGLISPLPFADDNQLQVAVVRQLSLAS